MEILGMKVLLPAVVRYRMDTGVENTVSCYFDPATGEVQIDDNLLYDKVAMMKQIRQYIVSKKVAPIIPSTPSKGFEKLKPETYMNNEQA